MNSRAHHGMWLLFDLVWDGLHNFSTFLNIKIRITIKKLSIHWKARLKPKVYKLKQQSHLV